MPLVQFVRFNVDQPVGHADDLRSLVDGQRRQFDFRNDDLLDLRRRRQFQHSRQHGHCNLKHIRHIDGNTAQHIGGYQPFLEHIGDNKLAERVRQHHECRHEFVPKRGHQRWFDVLQHHVNGDQYQQLDGVGRGDFGVRQQLILDLQQQSVAVGNRFSGKPVHQPGRNDSDRQRFDHRQPHR